uniref:NADH-ubiquinone oxidoreductase chain 6 n=1 Tax=Chloronia mirifica TaxID=1569770 RepID=A0A1N7TL82_9NEOP|nr:NADH dehydrogenase subunit 6 [Chloronia mirifica]ANT70543.1 NADH dehydrogenase subunit 6 [Chloronia mirifica]
MIKFIIMLNFIITFNFIQMKHPLAMGLILLIQTISICLSSGLLLKTFLFSYILFLIMLGGMLVLFIYMTSLASNEMFSISINNLLINLIMIMSLLLIMFTDSFNSFSLLLNLDMTKLNLFMNENSIDLLKLYNFPTMNLTILLINYLFLTLIVIVKITNMNNGPLRQMN